MKINPLSLVNFLDGKSQKIHAIGSPELWAFLDFFFSKSRQKLISLYTWPKPSFYMPYTTQLDRGKEKLTELPRTLY